MIIVTVVMKTGSLKSLNSGDRYYIIRQMGMHAWTFKIRLKLKFGWLQNPSLLHYSSLFLDIFWVLLALVEENTLTKYWLKWGNSFEWLQECLVTHSSGFSCYVTEGICIFLFCFISLAFLISGPLTYFNTKSDFNNKWIFRKMYIFTRYEFCIFKDLCSMYINKKRSKKKKESNSLLLYIAVFYSI